MRASGTAAVCLLSVRPCIMVQERKIQDRNQSFAGIQAEKENTIDVLVLGDSEAYTSISPLKFGRITDSQPMSAVSPARKFRRLIIC